MKKIISFMFIITLISCGHSQTKDKSDDNKTDVNSETKVKDYLTSASKKLTTKNYNGAIEDCNNALKENSNSGVAYEIRGTIKSIIHDTIGAIEDLNNAIKFNSKLAGPYMLRGTLKIGHDNKGALDDISMSIELDPDDAANYVARGQLEISMGNKNNALKDFKKGIEIFNNDIIKSPNDGMVYFS